MRSSRWTFASALFATVLLRASPAPAQACCAGSGAVTPARLGLHDDALVGVQLKAADQLGSYAPDGAFGAAPPGAAEVDLEQSVFGGVRLLGRGQLAALVPIVETYRKASGRSELGGGVGDVNLSARYDVVRARESAIVPGVGLLLGTTLPTGRAVESAKNPQATDATGIGAVQANGGLALEQAFGPWLVGVSGIVSIRAPRTVGRTRMGLAPQWLLLGAAGYAFDSGATAALVASYTIEADASAGGVKVPNSARRLASVSVAAGYPLTDALRLVGSLFLNPPLSDLGENQLAAVGMTLGATYSFL